jgi:hypothetical protein
MYNSPALSTYSTPMPIYHSYFQIKERQPAATEAAVHSPHSLAPLHKIENALISNQIMRAKYRQCRQGIARTNLPIE